MAKTLMSDALVLDAKLVRFAIGFANAANRLANCCATAFWTVALVTVAMQRTVNSNAFILRADFLLFAMLPQSAFCFCAFVLEALLNLGAVFSICAVVMSRAVNFFADFLFRDVINRANVFVESNVLAIRASSTRRCSWLLSDDDFKVAAVSS